MMAPSPSTYSLAALDPDFAASVRSGTANLNDKLPRLAFVWKVPLPLAPLAARPTAHPRRFPEPDCGNVGFGGAESRCASPVWTTDPASSSLSSPQDLAVAVRANGAVLLNYVNGRVTEGFYAVMARGPELSLPPILMQELNCLDSSAR